MRRCFGTCATGHATDMDPGRASTPALNLGRTSRPQLRYSRSVLLSVHGLRRCASPSDLSWPRTTSTWMKARCASRGFLEHNQAAEAPAKHLNRCRCHTATIAEGRAQVYHAQVLVTRRSPLWRLVMTSGLRVPHAVGAVAGASMLLHLLTRLVC